MNDNDAALRTLNETLALESGAPETWLFKAEMLSNDRKHAEALECAERAVELRPGDGVAWRVRGICESLLGNPGAALECYGRSLAANENDPDTWNARGVCHGEGIGEWDEALHCYDRALAIDSKHEKSLYDRGVALDRLGRCDDALKSYDGLLALNPRHASGWFNRGVVLINAFGRQEEALRSFTRAAALGHPRAADVIARLG